MPRDFSTFMDGSDCRDCSQYEQKLSAKDREIEGLTVLLKIRDQQVEVGKAALMEDTRLIHSLKCTLDRLLAYDPMVDMYKIKQFFEYNIVPARDVLAKITALETPDAPRDTGGGNA